MPLARWSGPELAAEITKAGLASLISPSSVLRILAEHPIKPWTARPFNWNYTATDLARFPGQINSQLQPASLPEAA